MMQSTDLRNTQQLAEEGDVAAQLQLGKLRLGQERYEDAASWLHRAAEQENPEAQCLYGSLLAEGLGVDQNPEAAAYWFRQAAQSGHAPAQVLLAESFESGLGVPANPSLAAQWYERAAEEGDIVAQFRLGQLLRQGSGVDKNLAEALKWLRKSAESGCKQGQLELAEMLIEAGDFDANEVMQLCKCAAEKGSAQASYRIGWLYENSYMGAANIAEAEKHYRVAAEGGSTDAQVRLSKLYAEGKITPRDQSEAEHWLNLAVASGKLAESKEVIDSAKLSSIGSFVTVNEYPPGSIIDNKYFIMSLLGRGGMCTVYKAKHLLMNKMVALKMLLPESAANAGLVERFKREAQAASSLNHPNVITIYDLGVSPDGKPFMVMDYLEGRSLDQKIESIGRLPLLQALSIFIQVCAGLEAAHEANIIHRDIKPSNIMLIDTKAQSDFVKVVDFGLAKKLDGEDENGKLTKTGEVFGTLVYMSPEQCLGHPLDARTDIYSVGCALYEAVTGKPVFRGSTPYDLMSKHINVLPEKFAVAAPDVQLPAELERIVFKTLEKDREERYQTIGELRDDLAKLLEASV